MVKPYVFNIVSHNVAVYRNVTTSLNSNLLYIIRYLTQYTAHISHLGGKMGVNNNTSPPHKHQSQRDSRIIRKMCFSTCNINNFAICQIWQTNNRIIIKRYIHLVLSALHDTARTSAFSVGCIHLNCTNTRHVPTSTSSLHVLCNIYIYVYIWYCIITEEKGFSYWLI
jgi:hypothetical protein